MKNLSKVPVTISYCCEKKTKKKGEEAEEGFMFRYKHNSLSANTCWHEYSRSAVAEISNVEVNHEDRAE